MSIYDDIKPNDDMSIDILEIIKTGTDENTNKNSELNSTKRDLMAGVISKHFATTYMMPKHIVEAHKKGIIHIHDLDYYANQMTNCAIINLEDMLQNGTKINGKLIEKPNSLRTACTIATQIVAQVASVQFGGQTICISHLAPFVRISKDKLFDRYKSLPIDDKSLAKLVYDELLKEIQDSIQTILYQINTLQTSNGQTPFLSIALDINASEEYRDETVMLIEELLRQFKKGLKNEDGVYITPTFPKLLYVLDDNNSNEDGEYWWLTKLACECVAKRMMPDFLSAKILRENYGDVVYPMGCRSFLPPYKDENGKLKWFGRLNLGVTSLNLPYIALLSGGSIDTFWQELNKHLCLCKDAMDLRISKLKGIKSDVAPILWEDGALARLKPTDKVEDLFKNGYATISLGYMGIYETVKYLTGKSHTTEEGEKLALEILQYMRNKCDEWRAENGYAYSLYGTPAESLTDKFAKAILRDFGEIKDITDKGYITNSYHVDIREKINAFDKLKFENQFHKISSGGAISYIEVDDMSKNIKAIENIVKFIANNCQYAEINCKFDYCYNCKFEGQLLINDNNEFECPCCANTNPKLLYHVRRTCGYLGSNQANAGRMNDFKNRVTHL